jgi:hypothetical protein
VVAWSSPAQPYLNDCKNASDTETDTKVCDLSTPLTDDEFSLVGSLFPVGALISGQVRATPGYTTLFLFRKKLLSCVHL